MKTLYLVFLPLIKFWYVHWSNAVQTFERCFLKTREVPKAATPPGKSNCCSFWEEFCVNELLYHSPDRWTVLWDAISLPGRVLERKTGDCDDYARLSYEVFGPVIEYCGRVYSFSGLKILLYGDLKKNHVIAVWNSTDSSLVVSNGNMYHTKDWLKSWKDGLLATFSIQINEKGKLVC